MCVGRTQDRTIKNVNSLISVRWNPIVPFMMVYKKTVVQHF